MEQTTLKYLRVLIPGLAFYLGAFPFVKYYFGDTYHIESLDFAYVTVFSLLAGAVYYQINLRLAIRPSLYFIQRNILNKLIAIYGKAVNPSQRSFLEKDRKFMQVFYRLTDNDESLKKKTNNVYFNGIFWTSSIDLFVLCVLFWLVYRWAFPQVTDAALFADLFLSLAILSIVLHVLSVKRHISLSNDQLGYIEIYKKTEVTNDFDAILRQMPSTEHQEG